MLLYYAALAAAALAAAALTWALAQTFLEGASNMSGASEREISRSLEAMFLFVPAKRLVDLGWMISAVVFLVVMLPFCRLSPPWVLPAGLCLAGAFAVSAFYLPHLAVKILSERRRERFNLQLLDALPMMANALRAGFSINQAFESVAEGSEPPIRQEFSLFLQQLRVGVSFTDALAELDRRVGSEDLTLICTAIDISRRSGGNLTEIFDVIADTIRARLRIHQHIKTLTAQGRLQGIIIGAMPFLLGIGMTIFKPGLMLPFICSLAGVGTLVAVVCLVGLGGWIIRKIITIEV